MFHVYFDDLQENWYGQSVEAIGYQARYRLHVHKHANENRKKKKKSDYLQVKSCCPYSDDIQSVDLVNVTDGCQIALLVKSGQSVYKKSTQSNSMYRIKCLRFAT